MKLRYLFVALTATALTLPFAAPASADTTGATITVVGGVMEINAPSPSANLGSEANVVQGTEIVGSLGQVVVTDARSAAAGSGWVASAISTAFTQVAGPSIAAGAVTYETGAIAKFGTATYTANNPASLTGVAPVLTATGITGDNSATWTPKIHVAVPGGAVAGVYLATITHSVV
jgi:hypothetical protein